MSVYTKLRRNNNPHNSRIYGRWFARATHIGTVTTDDLAYTMQQNCSLKQSDILAVICELVETMKTELLNSKRVKLNGLGTFKIGIKSKGCDQPEDYRPDQDTIGMHILFKPESTTLPNGKQRKQILDGAKVKLLERCMR